MLLFVVLLTASVNAEEITFSEDDWNELFNAANSSLCVPSYIRKMMDPPMFPDECPAGYPDDDGALLCYEQCPSGWTSDGLTMCYEDCPSGWTEVAGVCWNEVKIEPQGSYDRGAGVIPNSCGSGKVKEGGLCYNKCKSGYKGIGCTCWKGLQSYGRGCGSIPNQCPSSRPAKQNGLCYKKCPAAYPIAEAFLCWEDCEALGATDTGAFCQHGEIKSLLQDRTFRDSAPRQCSKGELSGVNCYEECDRGFHGELGVCWNQNLDNSIAAVLATSVQLPLLSACYGMIAVYAPFVADYKTGDPLPEGLDVLDFDPFLKCAWTAIHTMAEIDDSWDPKDGVTVAVTASATASAPVAGVNAYGGFAFEFVDEDNVNIWGFVGGCTKVTATQTFSIGIDAGMALFRNPEGIDGVASYLSMGINLYGIVDVGNSWAFDNKCQVSGMSLTAGVSRDTSDSPAVPVSFSAATGHCINFHRKLLGSMTSPAARSSAAKFVHSYPEPTISEQPHDADSRMERSMHFGDEGGVRGDEGGDEGGDYVFVLQPSSITMVAAIGLCAVLSVAMMVMLCLRCSRGMRKTRAYKKVMVGTDTEMEMDDLNNI